MNQLIIAQGIMKAPVVKSYIRKQLNKSDLQGIADACFCRVKNEFGIYSVELIIEQPDGEVIESMGRHFYVNKAFDLALSFVSKKLAQQERNIDRQEGFMQKLA